MVRGEIHLPVDAEFGDLSNRAPGQMNVKQRLFIVRQANKCRRCMLGSMISAYLGPEESTMRTSD